MVGVVTLLLCVAIIYGYVANIARLVVDDEDVLVKVIRLFGIFVFPALGVFAGFINVEKE